ncbi:unnamed protein product [Durusdinium trenchii]|uniref:Pentatricopeptide repeat-containing protein, chloroplastic n=1 Tax=Durusdinium trenchii TaxID=1381693 RepID=A0ABP0RUH2_9DINO
MLASLAGKLAKLARAQRWPEALEVWQELKRVETAERLAWARSALITACGNAQCWQMSLELLTQESKEGGAEGGLLDEGCCSAAITACGKGGQWDHALRLFASMSKGKLSPNAVSYNAAISACSRCTQWPWALELFERAHRGSSARSLADAFTFNATMASCGKGQQWKQSLHLFTEMQRTKHRPDKVTYGALVGACEKASEWRKALAFFSQMGADRDAISCATLISACERGRKWEEAMAFLEIMKCDSLQPSAILHGVVIGSCIKSGKLEEGLGLYQSMLEEMVPHEITTSSLVVALSSSWRWEEALQLAKTSALQLGVRLRTSAALISSVAAAESLSKWQEAVSLIQQYRESARCGKSSPPVLALTAAAACTPPVQSSSFLKEAGKMLKCSSVLVEHNAAITAAERSSHWALALHWLQSLQAGPLQPDAFSVAAGIRACEHAGHWPLALDLLYGLEETRIMPDVVVYSSAITACEKNHEWKMALLVFDHMQHASVSPNAITYSACISACARHSDWREALHLLAAATNVGHFTAIACNAVITACANGHEWQVPLLLLQLVEPTLVTFSSAISACERSTQWQHALQILSDMQIALFGYDLIPVNTCISACVKARQQDAAASLLRKAGPKTAAEHNCHCLFRLTSLAPMRTQLMAALLL